MEVKHTKLPWIAEQGGGKGAWIKREGAPSGDWSAMSCGNTHEEADENAAFIVRACNSHYELLEALRELYVDLVANDQDGLIEHVEPMRKARAAIAKAEGRL